MSAEKENIIKKFAGHEKDTGSTSVQVALITERINHLTEHLNSHKKDHSSRRSLLILAGQRRRLLKYLLRTNPEQHLKILQELKIRGN